jgi:hypothetical protein
MARGRVSAQRELFGMTEPTANLPRELTGRLLSLMEQLLLEVTATETSTAEGSNEQDHA